MKKNILFVLSAILLMSCGGNNASNQSTQESTITVNPEVERLKILIEDANKKAPLGVSFKYDGNKVEIVYTIDEIETGMDFTDPSLKTYIQQYVDEELLYELDSEDYILIQQMTKLNCPMVMTWLGHQSKKEYSVELSVTKLNALLKDYDSLH